MQVWTTPIIPIGSEETGSDSSSLATSMTAENPSWKIIWHFTNLFSSADPTRFPLPPAGFRREYRVRGLVASDPRVYFEVGIWDINRTTMIMLFTLPGSESTFKNIMNALSSPQVQLVNPPTNTRVEIVCVSPDNTGTGGLWSLYLEAHDMSIADGVTAPVRSIKSLSHPMKLSGSSIQIAHSGSPVTIGTYQKLFSSGGASLSPNAKRSFYIRVSGRDDYRGETPDSTLPRALEVSITQVSAPYGEIVFRTPLPDTHTYGQIALWTQCFSVAKPYYFGDGLFASIPPDDWKVTVRYVTSAPLPARNFYLSDLTLEARDIPVLDTHLPTSYTTSLAFDFGVLALPVYAPLDFSTTAFTVSVWVKQATDFYEMMEEDETDATKHVLVKHGTNYEFGMLGNGGIYATFLNNTNTYVTATYDNQAMKEIAPGEWHNVTLIWNATAIQLVLDGAFQESVTTTTLAADNNKATMVGGPSFAGLIRSVQFWGKALSQPELQAAMHGVIGSPADLLVNIQFASGQPLVNAPAATNSNPFNVVLPANSIFSVEGRVLSNAEEGCVCCGAESNLHLLQGTKWTLEAWACPLNFSDDSTLMRVIAGKLSTGMTTGYALLLNRKRVVAKRGSVTVTASIDLPSINQENPIWTHIAVTYDGSTYALETYLTFC